VSLLQGCHSTVVRKWGLKLLLSCFFSLSRISSTLALWRQNPPCPSQRTGCDSEGHSCLCVQMFVFVKWIQDNRSSICYLLYSDMIDCCVVISQGLGLEMWVGLDMCSLVCVLQWTHDVYRSMLWLEYYYKTVTNIVSLYMYINDVDYLADSIE